MRTMLMLFMLACSGCVANKPRAHVVAVPGYYAAGVTFTVGPRTENDADGIRDKAVLEALIRQGLIKQGIKVREGDVRLVIDPIEILDEEEPYWKRHPYITSSGVAALIYGVYEIYNRKGGGSSGGTGAIPGDVAGASISDRSQCKLDLRGAIIYGPFDYHCSENRLPPAE